MPKPLGVSLVQVYGSVASELMQRLGDAQAAVAGPPVNDGVEPRSDEKQVEAWNARAPQATDDAMLALAQQKYAEHRQQGLDEEKAIRATAEDLTHFRYDQRMKLYTYGQITFADQVKEAQRLSKLAARTTTPDPLPAPPTMPSAGLTSLQALLPSMDSPAPPEPTIPTTPSMPPGTGAPSPTVAGPVPAEAPPSPNTQHPTPANGVSTDGY